MKSDFFSSPLIGKFYFIQVRILIVVQIVFCLIKSKYIQPFSIITVMYKIIRTSLYLLICIVCIIFIDPCVLAVW